jgi:hypothetical protein
VRSIPAGARLFAAALAVYSVCLPFEGYDSYYVVPTALSLIRHGTTIVDEYFPAAPPVALYAVECVRSDGSSTYLDPGPCDGHRYNYFSPGVPVLAAPPIALIAAATAAIAAWFPGAAAAAPHPIVAAFLKGDLIGGRAIVELLCAALFGALGVWAMFRVLRELLPQRSAVWLALLFAFGTPEWSIGSRNLTQHGLTMLFLAATLYFAVRALEQPSSIAYAGLTLAIAFTVRPSNSIAAGVFTVYVALHYRRRLVRFLAWASPVAAAFFAYNLIVRQTLIPRYFHADSPVPHPPIPGFFMNWISPSRGVLIFTPVFLFALAGIVLAVRRRWLFPLSPYVAAILLLHSILISRYWGGHSYGPRYFSDMTPLFVFFLVPAVKFWQDMPKRALRSVLAAVFLLFTAWGVFVHARGATSIAANQWNSTPNVDQARWRVWDWRDPQVLRGLLP